MKKATKTMLKTFFSGGSMLVLGLLIVAVIPIYDQYMNYCMPMLFGVLMAMVGTGLAIGGASRFKKPITRRILYGMIFMIVALSLAIFVGQSGLCVLT